MTNEIKEIILDDLKLKDIRYHECKEKDFPFNTEEYQAHLLLDYITNLQEEKENAVECLKYYEEKHFIKPAVDNMKLTTELYNAYSKEINDLQQRINKANQLIEKQKKKMYKSRNKIAMYILINLENILRGDE